MMKKLLVPVLLLCVLSASAQLNNSWIDYSKTYFKFKVSADNLCRIPQATLNAVSLGAVNADNFQLWRNGQQIRLYTSVTGTVLGPSDYIEFWGQRNDGKADNQLYAQPQFQLADYYSLETDTSTYFLTVNTGGNLRFASASNPSPGSLAPDAYFMRSYDKYYNGQLNHGFGKDLGEYVYSSAYDNGEGYASTDLGAVIGAPTTFTEVTPGMNVYSAGPANSVSFRLKVFGNTDNSSRLVTARLFNTTVWNSPVLTNTVEGTAAVNNLPLSILTDPQNLTFALTTTAQTPGITDRVVIATWGITYPATFNFNAQKSFAFDLPASAAGNHLVIDNFNYGTTAPVLYDATNGRRYTGDITSTAGKVQFVLPPSADPVRKFILNNVETANINSIASLVSKTFTDYNTASTRGDYIIISNPVLYNNGAGVNNVDLYRQYRSSVNGGSFNVKIADINDLTDQFGFGIKGHPGSVRDFIRFMDVQYPVKPKFVLLIGRGLTYLDARPQESNAVAQAENLVPTFGWPASDILIASQPGLELPITPIGRIAAINGTEVGNYLQKMIQYEDAQRTPSCNIDDKAWMKNAMFIAGGADEGESIDFLNKIRQYTDTLIAPLAGYHTEVFAKSSVATVEQAGAARISELFHIGLGIIGYFGHSSANVFAFNLSNPELYDNTGKYPFFNVSGCSAGNFYTYDPLRAAGNLSLSEKYILMNQKGSIGFLADTHFGIPFALHYYNLRLFHDISSAMYGQRIGDQIKDVNTYLGGGTPSLDYYTRIHLEEINLHGDPALKINTFAKPDYAINDQSVTITPSIVSVADPSFHIKTKIYNIGRAINDSFRVSIKRLLPNTTTPVTVLDTLIKATLNVDSLEKDVPINPSTDKGDNTVTVTIDWTNRVDELCETNNIVVKTFTIFEDELRPVFPYNFAIVNTTSVTFSASTANPLVSARNYIMEVDTTELFNSPFKKSYTASGAGGVIQFTPTNIIYADSTVYYWRTAVVPSNNNYIWNNSSFVYLPASTAGFNQSHYYQHLKSGVSQVSLAADRQWRFDTYNSFIRIRNGVFPTAVNQAQDCTVEIDGSDLIQSVCGIHKIIFNMINPVNMRPVLNNPQGNPGLYGTDPVCGSGREANFQYDINSQTARNAAANFLLNVVPAGYYVTARLVSGTDPLSNNYAATWQADGPNSMYQVLKNAGFADIDSFNRPRAFDFIYRKNTPSFTPKWLFSVGINDKIALETTVPAIKGSGNITSPAFGPAAAWQAFHWRGKSSEIPTADSLSFKVIGVTGAGVETTLFTVDSTQKDFNISSVSAAQYPYIKLQMFTQDTVAATPYQLRYWRLNYTPVPEGAIAPNIKFTMSDTVEAGQPINFSVAFKNISGVKFDSLMKITLKIRTAANYDSIINIPKGKILISGDTLTANYTINSQNYPGKNTLYVEFNPGNDQPEQFHFNNFLYKDFYVKTDLFNPLLDVTFDGVHILSRDIVSSKPDILIKLKDENRFLALRDTGLLKVQLRYPDQSLRDFHFNNDTIRFTPANLAAGENAATIDFRPYLPEDGEYELVVTGKDVSGNTAGALNYHTVFTVINKPMISEMLNYPNPFTTSTAFVFTLTGSQVPQNLRIQILTITGKVVREVTKEELGPIHVGRNITEFKWDGTDMYGQKLANGVYIYRVITNLNGKSLDKYKAEGDNTDKFFNKGYGKMYLMR